MKDSERVDVIAVQSCFIYKRYLGHAEVYKMKDNMKTVGAHCTMNPETPDANHCMTHV